MSQYLLHLLLLLLAWCGHSTHAQRRRNYDYRNMYMRSAPGGVSGDGVQQPPRRSKCQLEIACRDSKGSRDSSMVRLPIRGPTGPPGPPGLPGQRGIAGEPGKPGIPALAEPTEEEESERVLADELDAEEALEEQLEMLGDSSSRSTAASRFACELQVPSEDECDWDWDELTKSSENSMATVAVDPLEWTMREAADVREANDNKLQESEKTFPLTNSPRPNQQQVLSRVKVNGADGEDTDVESGPGVANLENALVDRVAMSSNVVKNGDNPSNNSAYKLLSRGLVLVLIPFYFAKLFSFLLC